MKITSLKSPITYTHVAYCEMSVRVCAGWYVRLSVVRLLRCQRNGAALVQFLRVLRRRVDIRWIGQSVILVVGKLAPPIGGEGLVIVIVHLVNVFIRAGTSRSVAALTRLSSPLQCMCLWSLKFLLEQPLNATCRRSFVRKFCPYGNCLALYPFNWYKFLLKSDVRRWTPCYSI